MYKLRELKREDLKTINQWRNDCSLIEYLGAPFRFINYEVDVAWFEGYMRNRDRNIRCAIVKEDNEEMIVGLVSLTDVDHINRTASLHIMIGEKESRGHGIGTYAVKAILTHAFSNLNLNRVELKVLENNTRAIHLYEKVGFVKEGICRRANFKNGQYVNMVIMGLLKEEYKG